MSKKKKKETKEEIIEEELEEIVSLETVRIERALHKLTQYLKKFPPTHTIYLVTRNQIQNMYDLTSSQAYGVLCRYRSRSLDKFVDIYSGIPNEGKTYDEEWQQALEKLNQEGLYILEPVDFMSKQWGQISHQQKEDSTIQKAKSISKRYNNLLEEIDVLKLEEAQKLLNPKVSGERLLLPEAEEDTEDDE